MPPRKKANRAPNNAPPPATDALSAMPRPPSDGDFSPPWAAALCDSFCFPRSISALRERASQNKRRVRDSLLPNLAEPLLPEGLGEDGREPTRRDVLNLAWPHVGWLILGCMALALRLPFSLAMPHFVAQVIGALVAQDAGAARHAKQLFFACGVLDSIGDFFCSFLFNYCQQKIIRSLGGRVSLDAAIRIRCVSFGWGGGILRQLYGLGWRISTLWEPLKTHA